MKINLVQRGTTKPVNQVIGIDFLVQFDYMGSAEFEYGALPAALKATCKFHLQLSKSDIESKKGSVFILHNNAFKEIEEFLMEEWIGIHHPSLQEPTYFQESIEGLRKFDFWWDINNNWIAVVGECNAENVLAALKNVKKNKGW